MKKVSNALNGKYQLPEDFAEGFRKSIEEVKKALDDVDIDVKKNRKCKSISKHNT